MHAACRTQRCFKTASDASRCFHFSRFASYESCRASRCTQATYADPSHATTASFRSPAPQVVVSLFLYTCKNGYPQKVIDPHISLLPFRGCILFREAATLPVVPACLELGQPEKWVLFIKMFLWTSLTIKTHSYHFLKRMLEGEQFVPGTPKNR